MYLFFNQSRKSKDGLSAPRSQPNFYFSILRGATWRPFYALIWSFVSFSYREGVPVFDNVSEAVQCVVDKCKNTAGQKWFLLLPFDEIFPKKRLHYLKTKSWTGNVKYNHEVSKLSVEDCQIFFEQTWQNTFNFKIKKHFLANLLL